MKGLGYDYQIKKLIRDTTDERNIVESILEVGCGTGAAGLCLLEINCHARLLFTDNNHEIITKLITKASSNNSISFGVSDVSHPEKVTMLSGECARIENETYDVIFAGASIGYSASPKSTISSLYDILKPGGYIIDLEMRHSFWGRLISNFYDYNMVSLDQINSSVKHKGAITISKNISWAYFPLNLTRVFIMVTKPPNPPE